MIRRYLSAVVVGTLVSGCASVKLEGVIGDSCGSIAVNESALSATPNTDLLTTPIDPSLVTIGLAKALDLPSKTPTELLVSGVNFGSDFIPWIKEYNGTAKMLPTPAINEANHARYQISRMWKWIPGISSDFRANKVHKNKNVLLGTLTEEDAAFFSEVEKTLISGGYDALTLSDYAKLFRDKNNPGIYESNELKREQLAQEFKTAKFISTYYRAYLRGGRFTKVSLDSADMSKKIVKSVVDVLKEKVNPDDDLEKNITVAINNKLQEICRESKDSKNEECLLSRSLGDDSFVTRAGINVQFAGVSVAIGDNGKLAPALTYPNSTEFGSQLVRVAMEAVFDSHGVIVPAVSNSTACKEHLYLETDCLSEDDTKPAGTNGASKIDRIKKLDTYAAQAEATVTSAASKLIRGASISALNNEAVAKSVETLAGVSARKIFEKAFWFRFGESKTCSYPAGAIGVWVSE